MFINGLNQNTLNEIFDLLSQSNNDSIKRGQQLLQFAGRNEQIFPICLMNYLSNRSAPVSFRLRAALELQKIIDIYFTQQDDDPLDELQKYMTNLLSIYITTQWQVAKILRSIITRFELTKAGIRYLTSWDMGNDEILTRIMKIYSKALKNDFDETIMECAEELVDGVLCHLEEALEVDEQQGEKRPAPFELMYQLVKIMSLYARKYSKFFTDVELLGRSVDAMKSVLKLPVDQGNQEKDFKMKKMAFSVLCILSDKNKNQWKRTIEFFRYVVEMKKQNPDMSKHCLGMYLDLLKSSANMEGFTPKEKEQVLKQIFETAITMCYDPQAMYKLFIEDHSSFLSLYFDDIDEEESPTWIARCILKLFIKNHPTMWYSFFEKLQSQEDLFEVFISFLCESGSFHLKLTGEYHLPTPTIQTISKRIYQRLQNYNIRSSEPTLLSQNDLVKIICSLRFYCDFKNDILVQDLKNIALFCSKLALKCSSARYLCYYVINFILDMQNSSHYQGQGSSFEPVELLFASYKHRCPLFLTNLLEDASVIANEMEEADFKFISTIINHLRINDQRFEVPLKTLAVVILERCSLGGDPEVIDELADIPFFYEKNFKYPTEFTQPLLKTIKNKVINKAIAEMYITYLSKAADDPKTLTEIHRQLSNPEFFAENREYSYIYAHTLIELTKKMNPTSEQMRKSLNIAMNTLSFLCESKLYRQAVYLGLTICLQVSKPQESVQIIQDLYEVVLRSCSKSFILIELLITMMAEFPNTYQPNLRRAALKEVIEGIDHYSFIESPVTQLASILFKHFDLYFGQRTQESWRSWTILFGNILKRKKQPVNDRRIVTQMFCNFYPKQKPDIGKFLLQRYQVILTSWMFQFNMVIDI